LAGYASLDYIGSVFTLATIGLLPVIIAELLGPEASAYYYLPWTIAYAFWMIAYGVGMSLTTEGARDRGGLQAYASRALLQGIGLVVPAVVVLLVGAPWILLLFGPQYAAESTTLLRLLCLAAVPQVVTNLYISIARIQRSMLAVILVQAIVAGIVMTLSLVLLQPLGITGIGLAWLVAQVSVAGFLVCLPLRQVTIAALGRALPSFALTIMAKAIRIHPANKDAS
jgi:O-antigen/teichoic acid export membrane protein